MPRRAMRCVVDLSLHAVSAPGVWLPSKEDVYVSVSMFGQYRNTRLITSVFPLLIHEKFYFEKTYYSALDPSEVADYLEDELVIIELVQLSEYTDGAVRLASYSVNARDFLFPYPSLAPNYSSADREVLLNRTVAFPGISPKLEFATKTVIKESVSPSLDALEDALEAERERRTLRSRLRRSPTRRSRCDDDEDSVITVPSSIRQEPEPRYCHSTESSANRSCSPPRYRSVSPRRYSSLDYYDTVASRPPFVVRKTNPDLIGRVPGGTDSHAKSKLKKKTLTYSSDDLDLGRSSLKLSKSLSRSKSALDDLDDEVAALTSTTPTYTSIRPRSASPALHRPTFRERYGYPTYSSTYYSLLADRVRRRLEEERRAERIADLNASIRSYERDRDEILKTPPLQARNYTAPLRERKYTSPLQERKYTTPLQERKYTTPLQEGKYTTPLQERKYTTPLQEGKYTTPLQERNYTTPLLDRRFKSSRESHNTPSSHESRYTASTYESRYTPPTRLERDDASTLDRIRLSSYYPYYYYDPYLDDLDLSTRIARARSPDSQEDVDRGHRWTDRASDLSGSSRREVFTSNIKKSYNRLYRNSSSLGSSKV